jgi:hypothetical protein
MRLNRRVLFIVPFIAACGGSDPTDSQNEPSPSPPEVLRLTLSAATTTLVPSQQVPMVVSATLDNEPTSATGTTFISSASAVAAVNASGEITAAGRGSATITATLREASATLAVTVVEGGMMTTAGGTIASENGVLQLTIPAGAVAQPTAIPISEVSVPGVDPTAVSGTTFKIGSGTVVFLQPATLRLRYQPQNTPLGLPKVSLGVRSLTGATPTDIGAPVVDSINAYVTVTISQTGTFGVGRRTPSTPCTEAPYRALDFWLGNWNVSAGGQGTGQSSITLEPGGCAIFEEYVTPTSLSPGRSISFYEPNTDKWYQTYTDAGNNRIVLAGLSYDATSVVMRTPNGNAWERWSWIRLPDGRVRQVADFTANNGQSFAAPHWDGLYTRR